MAAYGLSLGRDALDVQATVRRVINSGVTVDVHGLGPIGRGQVTAITRAVAGPFPEVAAAGTGALLDLLERKRAEREGMFSAAEFGPLSVKRYPTGRLEVMFPDGYCEPDLSKTDGRHVERLMAMLPELRDALIWAGWF